MYAAVRAKSGDQVMYTLGRNKDRFEVLMDPVQVHATPGLKHIKPGLFALWNLNRNHLEWLSLNEVGWVVL